MTETTSEHQLKTEVGLTLSEKSMGYPVGSAIKVRARDFIAYEQDVGGTRVRLTGSRILVVRETTDQIDRLMRHLQSLVTAPSSSVSKDQIEAKRLHLVDATERQEAA